MLCLNTGRACRIRIKGGNISMGIIDFINIRREMMPTGKLPYSHNQLQQLRGFCQTARCGSVSKAAAQLYLSQPSVSQQIKALERDFGAKLLERRGARMELTREGELLFDMAAPVLDRLDVIKEEFKSQRNSADWGRVDIAAGGSTLLYVLPEYVKRFVEHYPSVELKLHNVTGKAGLERLRAGEADFAVGPLLDTPEDLSFFPIVAYEPMLITCLEHPLAKKKRITLEDISRYPLVLPPKHLSTWRVVESIFAEHRLSYDVCLEVGGWPVIKKYVGLGLGISIVMSICLREKGDEYLEARPVGKWFPKRTYGVVVRRNRKLSRHAIHFIHMMDPNIRGLEEEA